MKKGKGKKSKKSETSSSRPISTLQKEPFLDIVKRAMRKKLTEALRKDKNSVRFSNALKIAFQKRIA
jgi:hypothetical protein